MNGAERNWTIVPCERVCGEVRVPGDKSISHRLAMLCGVGRGVARITNFLRSDDCLRTLAAMEQLGARSRWAGAELILEGAGGELRSPARELDLGNSGTGIRLLTGLLAGHPIEAVLTGDASVRSRPMRRIQEPLIRMGAIVELSGAGGHAPIRVRGGRLRAIEYAPPVASAQVKSCVLLAGLRADGVTRVLEPMATRDHTERLMRAFGLPLRTDGDRRVELDGSAGRPVRAGGGEWDVPGDLSSAAFWIVAAAARPGGELVARNVGLNPRRTAVLDVLRRMGADVRLEPADERAWAWEPRGDVVVRGAPLKGTTIGGAEIPNLIDELPILSVAGALAQGVTEIRDAAELRVKESDRIAAMAAGLRAMGVDVEERSDGLLIHGGGRVRASDRLHSCGDHRIAMSLAVLALFADGTSVVHDVACVDTSYPGFEADLKRLTGGGV